MAMLTAPQYYLQIDEMQQHPNHTPNTDQHNRWSPPKALGNNIIVPRGHGPSMYCNGFGFQIQQRPATAIHFKTYSFYHNRGNIWVLNYDATRSAVGDGIDNHEHTQAHFFEDNENWTNWQPLMFNHYNNFSMACYGGERFTLLAPMADRAWMSILLPNIYHPLNASVHAGLTSELPIVLALLAFSITREYHPWLFQNGQWNRQLPYRPDLRRDCLGLVVRIWSHPPYSNELLQRYEQGTYGSIYFP